MSLLDDLNRSAQANLTRIMPGSQLTNYAARRTVG